MASSVASGPGKSIEKFSARRNSGSGTQRFSSTSSRCMIAIWPAGPPKLMKPSFTQKRKALANETGAVGGGAAVATGAEGGASSGTGDLTCQPPLRRHTIEERGREATHAHAVQADAQDD